MPSTYFEVGPVSELEQYPNGPIGLAVPGTPGGPGAPGASAYVVAVAGGFVGTEAEWLASLQGADGNPGPTAVSADAGNAATLGGDGLIFVPEVSAGVSSVNGQAGDVTLDASDIGAEPAGSASAAVAAHVADPDPHPQYLTPAEAGSFYATAAQGAKADSAVQPGDLAPVATSGDYSDLIGTPALGTAAASDATDFAPALGTDDNYVTDAEKVKLGNLSGTNSGDQVLPTWETISGKPDVVAAGATAADARTAIGAGTSNFDGAYGSLSGKPTLGGAAALDVGTAAGTVAAGDDPRFGAGGGTAVAEDLTTTETNTAKVLSPDGAGGVQWATPAGGSLALGDLTDVSSAAAAVGTSLIWTGTEWAPANAAAGGIPLPLTTTWESNGFNGIINALGLILGGTGTYTNPGLLSRSDRLITPSQSSDIDGTRIADKAFDHLLTYNGGEIHTVNANGSWWMVDFGSARRFTPTRFGLCGRYEGGGNYAPRNFKVQGSNDASAWTDLYTAVGEGPDPISWWSVAISGSAAYRYIRLYETGVNAQGDYYLVVGEIEMWGVLSAA